MAEIDLHLPPEPDDAPACTPGPDGRCAVCADEGRPGQVLERKADNMALVEVDGAPQEVALDLVEAEAGDWVLVHLGFAIARLEEPPATGDA